MCVVGDDAESRVGRVALHDSAESHLRCGGHGIRFVQNDQFETGKTCIAGRLGRHGEDLFCACKSLGQCSVPFPYTQKVAHTGKSLDLFSDDINATIITGVQLQHHLPHILGAIYPSCEGEDGRGLAGSGRSIQEKMR